MEVGIAAMLVLGGAQLYASGQQSKMDMKSIDFNESQTKLQLAQQGFENAKSFRQNIASQVALSSVRGGAGSTMLRQFGSQSFANFVQDQASLSRTGRKVDASAGLQRGQAQVGRFSRDLGILGNTTSNIFNVVNFSNMQNKSAG